MKLARPQTRTVVAAASNCDKQLVLSSKLDGKTNIPCVRTLYDRLRMSIDHAVVDFTGLIVILVFGKNDCPAKISFQLANNLGIHGTLIRLIWRNSPQTADNSLVAAIGVASPDAIHEAGASKPRRISQPKSGTLKAAEGPTSSLLAYKTLFLRSIQAPG